MVELLADDGLVFVSVPENVTRDVAGNKNLASNFLQVRHCKIFLILLINFFFGDSVAIRADIIFVSSCEHSYSCISQYCFFFAPISS